MIDYIQHFKNEINRISPVLIEFGYSLISENLNENPGNNTFECKFKNNKQLINLYVSISRFQDQTYLASFSMFNSCPMDNGYTWDSFFLSDYIKDTNLQDKFIYKIQGDEKVEEFIDQYFKNLEFALNNYLKPYVTGEKYIDHYQRMRDQFYEYTAYEQEEKNIIKEHLAKKGKLAVFRQKVIVLKQGVRQFIDKFKSLFTLKK